jgi:hypothetical protein
MIFWLINDDGSIFIIESSCGLIGGKGWFIAQNAVLH